MSQKTVTINGVKYDAHTGLRLDGQPASKQERNAATATQMHQKAQRAKTLKRSHVKAPVRKTPVKAPAAAPQAKPVQAKSPMIRRFASHDVMPAKKRAPQQKQPDTPPPSHPMHEAAKAATVSKKPVVVSQKSPKEIKQHEMTKALAKSKPTKHKQPSIFQRHPRLFSVATAGLLIVLLAGYVTYVNLPFISVKIAAIQAGIKADYPSYRPSGYSLKGPVEFTPGTVTMRFVSNTSTESFTITQSKSDWDSSSLLENYIRKEAGDNFITVTENGLTIYRYGTNAAWVNGGILHKINGDAQLSDIQIKRIATSM